MVVAVRRGFGEPGGGAVESDDRCADSGCEMSAAGIGADEEFAARQQRGHFGDACASCEICDRDACGGFDFFAESAVGWCTDQHGNETSGGESFGEAHKIFGGPTTRGFAGTGI